MENPYWYKLILFWVKKKGRSGLTIPFIIGAGHHKLLKEKSDSVSHLLNAIVSSDFSEVITLFYCNNIGEYVLGLNNLEYPMPGLEIRNDKTKSIRLIATYSTEILGKSFDSIILALSKKYQTSLSEQKYSLINCNWSSYSDTDILLNRRSFKRLIL